MVTIDKICGWVGEIFDAPCNYILNDVELFEFINETGHEDSEEGWCAEHCEEDDYAKCWKRFFELLDKHNWEIKL